MIDQKMIPSGTLRDSAQQIATANRPPEKKAGDSETGFLFLLPQFR
jgi:hypothetical protein